MTQQELPVYLFRQGTNYESYRFFGAHPEVRKSVSGYDKLLVATDILSHCDDTLRHFFDTQGSCCCFTVAFPYVLQQCNGNKFVN